MIERYARPEMTAIWSAATKYRIWFEIEAHGCDALEHLGSRRLCGIRRSENRRNRARSKT